VVGTCRIKFGNRSKVKSVKGRVQDRDKAKLIEIEVDSDSDGSATHTLPLPYADEAEARKAATAKAKELKRQTITTSVTLYGDPAVRAGALFFYHGVRPEIDEIDFIIESATHRLTKSGYTVDVEAKLYVPAGSNSVSQETGTASGAGGGTIGGAGGTSATSTATDSQSLRPPQFQSPRSLGPNIRL
jgi:phage protein D